MSSLALTDATTWVAGYDMTTDLNQIGLSLDVEALDNTTFGGGGYHSRLGGLKTVESKVAGFWQSATLAAVDPQVFPALGTADQVVTIGSAAAETSTAYMFQAAHFKYGLFDEIGKMLPFSLEMMGTNGVGVARGQVAMAKQNISTTGAKGTVCQLGAVASGKYLYCAVHTFAIGTSFTLQIQSDNASNFPSPATQITVGSITAVGGTWGTRVAGPITDDWFRVNVSAVSGTSSIAVAIGIA